MTSADGSTWVSESQTLKPFFTPASRLCFVAAGYTPGGVHGPR